MQPAPSVDYTRARRLLARRDPVLRQLIRCHGPCGLGGSRAGDPFHALVHAIIAQQLSTRAAATIAKRVDDLFESRPTPGRMMKVTDGRLGGAGVSRQKRRYLRDLCRHVQCGSLDLDALDTLADEDVVQRLTAVNGIGRWTAEMFLIFRLRRPDVLPLGDLGLVKAIKLAYRFRARPTPGQVLRLGEAWRPYRSVACWYLWASLDNVPVEE